MTRIHQLTLLFACASIMPGCDNSLNSSQRNAPLQLSMRAYVQDELTLEAPDDVTFDCDQSLNEAALAQWLSSAGVESTCENAQVLNDFTGISDDCSSTGSATVTWTASDDCGNIVSHTATFAVIDETEPTIDGPADMVVGCAEGRTELALQEWLDSATASDLCGTVELDRDDIPLSDGCFGIGSMRSTWTAVDLCGNSSSHTATFTIRDTTPMFVVIPPNPATVECDGEGNQSAYERWLNAVRVEGGCGNESIENEITRSHESCTGASTQQITWTATDECDATTSASSVFTIKDSTAPRINQPNNLELVCGSPDNRPLINDWLNAPEGHDLCSSVEVTNDFDGLDRRCGAAGHSRVTWTAQDDCGNETSVSADLRVTDTTAPTLEIPDSRRFCTGDSNLSELRRWLMAANAEDECSDVTITNDFSRDRVPDTCVFDVSWTAEDECGNHVSDTATASIQDTDPPVLTVNGNAEMTLECNLDTYVERGAMVVDACDIGLNDASVGGDSVDISTPGIYTVNYDAADLCGNEGDTVSRTVEIVDTMPPFAPDGIALELWPPNHNYKTLSLADCVRDLCETDLDVDAVGQIVEIYSDEPENANGDGNTVGDIVILDNSSFMLRVERQGGSNGRVYGVTFDISDSTGNETRDVCYIAVPHDQDGQTAVDDGPGSGYTVQR